MKRCCSCLSLKDPDHFYSNRSLPDGLSRRCKACVRELETSGNREAQKRYLSTDLGKTKRTAYIEAGGNNRATAKYRSIHTVKRFAMNAVNNALARGLLSKPVCCSECTATGRLNAHHDDYAQSLAIRWLCVKCHKDWHVRNGEGANAASKPLPYDDKQTFVADFA